MNSAIEEPKPVIPIVGNELLLVDGANVMNATNRGARMEILLVLLVELKKGGAEFCCIFDANVRFQLRKSSGIRVYEAYLKLLDTYPHQFAESTGGLRADELLLQRADTFKQRIITNDRFNDFKERYVWLKDENKHLVKFAVVGHELQVPSLGILAELQHTYGKLVRELIVLLGNQRST
jgi:hypothetical protein